MDISKVTPTVAVEMGVKGDLESPPKAVEEPTKELGRSTTEVNAIEAIAAEPISVVPTMEIEDLEVGKKSEPIPTVEPTITDTEKLEQSKKESTKKSSDALVIIQ